MWRKLTNKEVEEQIAFEETCGVNTTLQLLFDEQYRNKNVSLWTFNEGQNYEVRENENKKI